MTARLFKVIHRAYTNLARPLRACLPFAMAAHLALRFAQAMLLSAVVGVDRALSAEPGGMCAHAIAGTGACLFVTLQGSQANVVMASAVLASATMFKAQESVRGLNTALSVWVAAGIGAACGEGRVAAATAAALATATAQALNRACLAMACRTMLLSWCRTTGTAHGQAQPAKEADTAEATL